jgi:glutamyl-tRNA reductase
VRRKSGNRSDVSSPETVVNADFSSREAAEIYASTVEQCMEDGTPLRATALQKLRQIIDSKVEDAKADAKREKTEEMISALRRLNR